MNMKITTQNLPEFMNRFNRDFIGFNDIFRLLEDTGTALNGAAYPPYNIIQDDENTYRIELAVAGFGEKDIDITIANRKLLITGKKVDDSTAKFIHKGISNRNFERSFILAQNVEIKSADLVDGMLVIELEHIVPEELKPQTIKIKKTRK